MGMPTATSPSCRSPSDSRHDTTDALVGSAKVEGSRLIFDVTPRDDLPLVLFQIAITRDLSFAACAT